MNDAERDDLLIRLDERMKSIKEVVEASRAQQAQLVENIKAMGEYHDRELAKLRSDLNTGLTAVRTELAKTHVLAFSADERSTEVRRWVLAAAGLALTGVGLALLRLVVS